MKKNSQLFDNTVKLDDLHTVVSPKNSNDNALSIEQVIRKHQLNLPFQSIADFTAFDQTALDENSPIMSDMV